MIKCYIVDYRILNYISDTEIWVFRKSFSVNLARLRDTPACAALQEVSVKIKCPSVHNSSSFQSLFIVRLNAPLSACECKCDDKFITKSSRLDRAVSAAFLNFKSLFPGDFRRQFPSSKFEILIVGELHQK